MKQAIAMMLLVLGLPLSVSANSVQMNLKCTDHERLVEWLSQKYNENRVSYGLINQSTLLEIWASESSRTWTVLITSSNGRACLVSSGYGFVTLEKEE